MTRDRAKHLCIEKLARLLYECVDCALEERAKTDWETAARYIDVHPEIVDVPAHSCWPDSFDSNAFEQTYGEHVYNQAFLPLIGLGDGVLPRPPYEAVRCGG